MAQRQIHCSHETSNWADRYLGERILHTRDQVVSNQESCTAIKSTFRQTRYWTWLTGVARVEKSLIKVKTERSQQKTDQVRRGEKDQKYPMVEAKKASRWRGHIKNKGSSQWAWVSHHTEVRPCRVTRTRLYRKRSCKQIFAWSLLFHLLCWPWLFGWHANVCLKRKDDR